MAENDLDLVNRFKSGDRKAFDKLVELYMKRIYYTSLRITRNQADAEEITQDTFVKAYEKIAMFKQKSSFYTWIHRIAVNLSLNHVKQNARMHVGTGNLPEQSLEPDQLESLVIMQQDNRLSMAVANLPVKQRTTFILRIFEGMTTEETAKIMKCSEGTVKANLFFATKALRKELQVI